LFERTQRLQGLFTQRRINLDHGHRFTTALAASEMKATDVHATLAQDRADAADHAGHVVIARYEHVAVWRRFEMKAVDLSYTSFASLSAIAKERSGQALR